MYMVIILLIVVFGIAYLVGRCKNSEKILKVSTFFLKNIVFSFLFFSVNNMGFSLGAMFRYRLWNQTWTASLYVSWILAALTVVLLVGYLYYYVRYTVEFTDFSDKFLDDMLSQCHYAILLIARYLLNLFCGYFNDHSELCYAVVVFEVVCFIYIVVKRPYKKFLFTFLAWLNEFSIIVILTIDMYYRNFATDTTSLAVIICGWVQIALVLICVVANYVALFVYIYQRCKSRNNKVHDGAALGDKDKEIVKVYQEQLSKEKLKMDKTSTTFEHSREQASAELIYDDEADEENVDQKYAQINLDRKHKREKKKKKQKAKRWF